MSDNPVTSSIYGISDSATSDSTSNKEYVLDVEQVLLKNFGKFVLVLRKKYFVFEV